MTLLRNGQIPAAADWNHVGKDKEFKITLEGTWASLVNSYDRLHDLR